ncbi:MAG: hypothetical protein IJ074_07050 [Clostridia bacterium]|nr:hypothetical protein [Clostridia bacterium]
MQFALWRHTQFALAREPVLREPRMIEPLAQLRDGAGNDDGGKQPHTTSAERAALRKKRKRASSLPARSQPAKSPDTHNNVPAAMHSAHTRMHISRNGASTVRNMRASRLRLQRRIRVWSRAV